jgi:glycerol-3-phosphate dehydrogenase (NAD(P)+)
MSGIERVAIAGSGAFGTALAVVAAQAGRRATLFARDAEQARIIASTHQNIRHLPGLKLPAEIEVTSDPLAFGNADVVILAAPAQATRALAGLLAKNIREGTPVIAAAKGIERETGKLQTQIVEEIVPHAVPAVLSGPGFAEEIARGLPTAVTIAAADIRLARELTAALATDTFRPYAGDDPIGVELGGAIKNVLAIACGVVAGRRLGESARAALIARGLAEMMRLGGALGARPETFMGLSGLGDLVLTATGTHSRNLKFGIALGEGHSAAALLGPGEPLVEGAHTARVAAQIARRLNVDAPILSAIADVIDGIVSVDVAIAGLLARPLTSELV